MTVPPRGWGDCRVFWGESPQGGRGKGQAFILSSTQELLIVSSTQEPLVPTSAQLPIKPTSTQLGLAPSRLGRAFSRRLPHVCTQPTASHACTHAPASGSCIPLIASRAGMHPSATHAYIHRTAAQVCIFPPASFLHPFSCISCLHPTHRPPCLHPPPQTYTCFTAHVIIFDQCSSNSCSSMCSFSGQAEVQFQCPRPCLTHLCPGYPNPDPLCIILHMMAEVLAIIMQRALFI